MSRISIKFLISIFFVSIIQTYTFKSWLNNINESTKSHPIELSMRLESYKVGNSKETIIDDKFYFRFFLSDSTYQIKFLDNMIFYDGVSILQLNQSNNQVFKFFPDKKIQRFLNQEILNLFLNFTSYSQFDIMDSNRYKFNESILEINNDLIVSFLTNSVDVYYLDEIYEFNFKNIKYSTLDKNSYENDLLINFYQDNENIEFFDFTK
tara:strand:+ start:1091 stop:1714 length:624 start_codon:yes stop_codon:yes gene_type:complete